MGVEIADGEAASVEEDDSRQDRLGGGTMDADGHLGSGGVMLPNHAPLVIAEQFGTLNTLYPGRIDLGLGRAPGSDQPTMRALRRRSVLA